MSSMPQPDQRQADTARTSHPSLSTNPYSHPSSSDGVVRGAAPHINGSCQQQPQQQDATVESSSWNDYPSSDQSIKNSNTGNGDDHSTHWTATTTTTSNPSTKQFTCLYTKHKTQKRKIWQDGRLVVQSTRALLYDAHPPPGASNEPLDECELTMIQSQSIRNSNETNVCMEKFLIQIEGVWKQQQEICGTSTSMRNNNHNGSNNTIHINKSLTIRQSKGMQKVMSCKFRKPGKYIPPHPQERKRRMESENKNHLFGKRRKAPLQPGELERKYYGQPNNDNDWNGNHEGRAGGGGWNHHHPRSHHDGYVPPNYDSYNPPETQRRHYNNPSSSSDVCVDAKRCRLDNMQESRLHHQESCIVSAGEEYGQVDRGNMSRSSSSKFHEMDNSNECRTNNANNSSSFILSHPPRNERNTGIGSNGMAPSMREKEKTRNFAKNEFDPSTYYGEEDDDDGNDDGDGSATEDEKKWDEGPNGQFTHAGQGNQITMRNGPLLSRIDCNNVSDKNIHNERRTLTKRVRFDDDDDTNAFQVNEKFHKQFRDAGGASEGRVGPANLYRKENSSLRTATYHRDQNKEESSINHTNNANSSSFGGHNNNSNNNVLSKMELLELFSAGPLPSSVSSKSKPSKFMPNHQSHEEMEVMPPKSNDNNDRRHDEVGICDHRKDDDCVPSNKENEHPVMFLPLNKHTDGSNCRNENNPFLQGLLRKEKEVDERISSTTSMTLSSAFSVLVSSQQPSGCDEEDEYDDDDCADDNDLWHEKDDKGADDDALDDEDEKDTNPVGNDDRDEEFQFILPSASESSSCDDEDDKEDKHNDESAEQ